ncbi:MAG TPA: hypothetical protein VG650_04380 [Mycobacteriales bacterium]|nr:hypothetical protein [Mycobacteriales bacterium]
MRLGYRVARGALVGVLATTMVGGFSSMASAGGKYCLGVAGVQNVSYVLTAPDGSSRTVTTLLGNATWGDTVQALFTVPTACAPEQLSMASYDSFVPLQDLSSQMLYDSQSATFGAGPHSLTVQIPPAPSGSGALTISGSMEGNLPVHPGDTLRAGYDFTMPGSHPAATVTVSNAQVSLTVKCQNGSTVPVTIALPTQSYQDPANSSGWYPSGDQQSSLVYQGSATMPANLCGAQTGHAPAGATFSALFHSTDTTDSLHVRFHYADNTSGSWSGTAHMTPPRPSYFHVDFATGPVQNPPPYPNFIDGASS